MNLRTIDGRWVVAVVAALIWASFVSSTRVFAQEVASSSESANAVDVSVSFRGVSKLPREQVAEKLSGYSFAELQGFARELMSSGAALDGATILNYALLLPDATEEQIVAILPEFYQATVGRKSESSETYDKLLAARPDSWRVRVACMRFRRETTSGRPDRLQTERLHMARLAEYESLLPLVRKEVAEALEKGTPDAKRYAEIAGYYLGFCRDLMSSHRGLMNQLTDFSVAPTVEPPKEQFAPVDANGEPIFYATPSSYEESRNDGERVLALVAELEGLEPLGGKTARFDALMTRADFARALFGTLYRADDLKEHGDVDSEKTMRSLKDDETIVKLSNGLRRLTLPKDYDYIAMWRRASELDASRREPRQNLALEYKNRAQNEKALQECLAWKELAERAAQVEGDRNSQFSVQNAEIILNELKQTPSVANHMNLDASVVGLDAELRVNYNDASSTIFVVKKLDAAAVVDQLRTESFWRGKRQHYVSLYNRIYQLLDVELADPNKSSQSRQGAESNDFEPLPDGKRLIGTDVASFEVDRDLASTSSDGRQRVPFPIHEPGVYLVEATGVGGASNVVPCSCVVWLSDRAVVTRMFDDGCRFTVYEPASGKPLEGVDLDVVYVRYVPGRATADVETTPMKTDATGSAFFPFAKSKDTLVSHAFAIVRSSSDASKYAFSDVTPTYEGWIPAWRDPLACDWTIATNQPIYRPGDTVELSAWIDRAPIDANFAERGQAPRTNWTYHVIAPDEMDGEDEPFRMKEVQLDEFDSFSDSFELPQDAAVGVYTIRVGKKERSFRVEELAGSNFDVTIETPDAPTVVGEKLNATIVARDRSGKPVSGAEATCRVKRRYFVPTGVPEGRWDWLFGAGYRQLANDAVAYPGWLRWGARRSLGRGVVTNYWIGDKAYLGKPELCAEKTGTLDADGKLSLSFDTLDSLGVFTLDAQEYTLDVEVKDPERGIAKRSCVAYADARPFKTFVWFERGHYAPNENLTALFQARRVDDKPVVGTATVTLYRVSYDSENADGSELFVDPKEAAAQTLSRLMAPSTPRLVNAKETAVLTREVQTDAEGRGTIELDAQAPGQYRLSCVVTTPDGASDEGGCLIVVRGADASSYRCVRPLEITLDKSEYAVGDVARVQIASSRPDAYVFVSTNDSDGLRQSSGAARLVRLENGVGYVDVEVRPKQDRALVVSASTVFDGVAYYDQRFIPIPPKERTIDVTVTPGQEQARPGDKARVTIRLTDADGAPVVAKTAVAVYDAALDEFTDEPFGNDRLFWRDRTPRVFQSRRNVQVLSAARRFERPRPGSRYSYFDSELTKTGFFFESLEFPESVGSNDLRPNDELFDSLLFQQYAKAAEVERQSVSARDAGDVWWNLPAQRPETKLDRARAPRKENVATLREDRRDCAFWAPGLTPDADGKIELEFETPEGATTWKIVATACDKGLRIGGGEARIVVTPE